MYLLELTRALTNVAVVFTCFVMRWRCLGFLLAAPFPLHVRNMVLESEIGMKGKSSLPQTPTGGFSPIPRGPEVSLLYFLSIIRSIKSLRLYAAQDPVEPLVNMES